MATIKGQNGDDLNLRGTEQNDTIYGDPAFGSGTDYIYGLGGDDDIRGMGGTDYLFGGLGKDTIYGDEGNDNLYGNEDNDTLYGFIGNDNLFGGFGDDELRGGSGDDFVYGGDGNDVIYEYEGVNTLEGNGGNDTFYLSNSVNSPPNAALVKGGIGNDYVDAYTGSYTIYGEEGDDYIKLGNPILPLTNPIDLSAAVFGGRDNDTYVVGPGVSFQYVSIVESSNEGYDALISFSNVSRLVIPENVEAVQLKEITPALGKATVQGTAQGNDIYAQDVVFKANGKLEILAGDGDDNIFGSESTQGDLLFGKNGYDYLNGYGGNDKIDGGNDSDYLYGGKGNDTLIGGSGSDVLIGEIGKDTLTGGVGTDSFGFSSPGDGVDRITDFNSIDDQINIYSYEFPVPGFTGQSGTALPTNMFRLGSSALDGDDRFVYDRSRGELFFDQDGSGAASKVLIATLANNPVMAANDIVIF